MITNEHVVKDAAQIRLVTGAGIIAAKVVKEDATNDLALLKAGGKFTSLPVAASRAVNMGLRLPRSVFPTSACKGSRQNWPKAR